MEEEQPKSGYGKRPWWVWLIIYLIIGVIVYGAIYFLFFRGGGGIHY